MSFAASQWPVKGAPASLQEKSGGQPNQETAGSAQEPPDGAPRTPRSPWRGHTDQGHSLPLPQADVKGAPTHLQSCKCCFGRFPACVVDEGAELLGEAADRIDGAEPAPRRGSASQTLGSAAPPNYRAALPPSGWPQRAEADDASITGAGWAFALDWPPGQADHRLGWGLSRGSCSRFPRLGFGQLRLFL